VEDRFLWFAAGRLSEAKNYPNMIDAFAALGDTKATLLIAGRGPLEAELQNRIQIGFQGARNLQDRVRLLGARRDMPELMNAADGYVMSSNWEGMPLVLQEASAAMLPIVATDVGGNPEVILDGRTGLLVPSKDSAALAGAIRRVMSMSPEERRQMGRAAREHVAATFDLERVLDQWEQIYHGLLARKRNGAVAT
jgi:glycosyltransferase involved in cell wall biosynthesis